MTADTTPAPLFCDYVVRLLLAGPVGLAYNPAPDAATHAEVRQVWGRHGEKVGVTWRLHETFLRAAAAERNLRPRFAGKFFAEAMQKGTR